MYTFISTLSNYIPMCLDCYIIYHFFGYTLSYKYNSKYRFLSILPILFISILRYQLAETSLINNSIYNFTDTILLYSIIFFCGIFFYKNRITTKILWTVISLLVLALGEVTVFMLIRLVNIQVSEIQHNQEMYMIVAVATKIVALFIVELIGHFRQKTLIIPRYAMFEIYSIIGINFFLIIFSVWIFQSNNEILNKDTILTLLFILCFTISVLTFTIIFKLSKKAEEDLEEKLRLQQLEMENKMNVDMTNVIENLRSLRHDMNNHISVLKGLVNTGQYDDLRNYVDEIYNDISPANEFVFTHNKALSALLYNKMLSAKLKHIEFEPIISISDCSIPDKDMCSLLGNLLDNAIEAAEKVKDNKYIELTIAQKNDCYLIQCDNTFQNVPIHINGNFVSFKPQKELHGIGTKNIKSIVEKYGGSLLISYEDLFRVEITLPSTLS